MKNSAYKDAGVDIEAGDALVEAIKPLAKSTYRSGTMGGIGGFGALFDVKAAGYADPVIVSSTDGVGTKLRVAIDHHAHDTVGIDLVAMCVNDLIVQGAEPLFFLDYFASSRLNLSTAQAVMAGIAEGCRQAGCALIGGETAEMPSMYEIGDYDLAGFSVGAVERSKLLTGEHITAGDQVIGIASSGLHSNGFSLVRKIIADHKLSYADRCPYDQDKILGDELLTPTKIYIRSILPILKTTNLIKGLANITGGGLLENIPRVIPNGFDVELNARLWDLPPVFAWLKKLGGLDSEDMARTLNCGIGMVAIASPTEADQLMTRLRAAGEDCRVIGEVVRQKNGPTPNATSNPTTNTKSNHAKVFINHMDEVWN